MLHNIEIYKPDEIEKRSFEIIREILGGKILDKELEAIIIRVIHTTADFEYTDLLKVGNEFVKNFVSAIKSGAQIVTDTRMAWSGISKPLVERFGGSVQCFMDDPLVADQATRRNVTRASVCIERACEIDKDVILVVGNAPTALIRLYELNIEGKFRPKAVVGVPVGFVNVVESKELLCRTELPYILSEGRKGGSNVAAAIVNALLKGMV